MSSKYLFAPTFENSKNIKKIQESQLDEIFVTQFE